MPTDYEVRRAALELALKHFGGEQNTPNHADIMTLAEWFRSFLLGDTAQAPAEE